MTKTVSNQIAEWIAGLAFEDIPDIAKIAAEDTVIDTVALAVAAMETDYGRAVRAAFPGSGTATVWGRPGGADPTAAAIINGTCGHGEDYDNTYEGCPVHSGVVIVPALIAAGEAMALSNADVARGIVIGIEIANRLGAVAGRATHTAGFHPTAIFGTIGAAAGVAAAMRQTPRQIVDSLGVAGSMAAGIIEYLADGSWTKRMHAGWAAQSGLAAARMGAVGFRGPSTVFEGSHGLYSAFAPSITPETDRITEGLGTRWEAAAVAFKPYACGTMTQPFIDCAIRLREAGVKAEEIESILCEVGEGTVHRLWEPIDLKRRPPGAYGAKFSGPYAVAAGLVYGGAGLAQFTEEAVSAPRALEVAAKVSYVVNPHDEYPKNYTGHVRATLKDGRVVEERQGQLRGGTRDPMPRAEIREKARANLVFAGHDAAADALADFARALFDGGDDAFDGHALKALGT